MKYPVKYPADIQPGLAMTAVTTNMADGLFPPSFFEKEAVAGPGPHALTIAARILNDPELAYGKGGDPNSSARFQAAIKRSGERLRRHFDEWTPEGNFTDKYEELVWLVTSIYGFSGWRKGEEFKANFFMYNLFILLSRNIVSDSSTLGCTWLHLVSFCPLFTSC
jgi:hypothetical protein